MRRALPTIVLSAAGVTWLLHAQGVIDASGAPGNLSTDATTTNASTAGAGRAPASSSTARNGSASAAVTTTTRSPGSPTTSTGPLAPGRGVPSTTTPPRSTATSPTSPTTTIPAASDAGGAVSGPSVSTRFGPVQVSVVVSAGQVADVKALQYPSSARRSKQINDRALPILRQEVVSAQSANIDSVSGATITSDAYATSLQAALDAAGFKK